METEIINNEVATDIAACTEHTGDIGLGQCALIAGGIALGVGIVEACRKGWAAYKKRHELHLVGKEESTVEETPEV